MKITIYYDDRSFLLAGNSFVIDRTEKPYRRLSATLLVAHRNTFDLYFDHGRKVTSNAVIVSPNTVRNSLQAVDSDILIIDLPIDTDYYDRIRHLFENDIVRDFSDYDLSSFRKDYDVILKGEADKHFIECYRDRLMGALNIAPLITVKKDSRVDQVIDEMKRIPLRDVNLEKMATLVHLSSSRLRHLFKEKMGCTISHYARWLAVWKFAENWNQGKTLTELSEESGFYDLAHMDKAFIEVFGLNPTQVVKSDQVHLIKLS